MTHIRGKLVLSAMALLLGASAAFPLRAEVTELRISKQYGLPFMAMMVMERQALIEKYAAKSGIADLKISWTIQGGTGGQMQSLLAGQVDFITPAIGGLLTMWDKTVGTPQELKALSALQSMPYVLVSRNPEVKTIRDFTERDKIALPEVKLSGHATILEIAAAKEWGFEHFDKLDPITVTFPHPDATAAMLTGRSEINAHFASSPFYYIELADPAIHKVLHSYDVLGRHTNGVLLGSTKFHDGNPKICAAIFAALEEANLYVKEHPRESAELYIEMAKEKRSTPEEMTRIVSDPDVTYTTTPVAAMKFAEFLFKVGRLKHMPASWKDLFFPEAHHLSGS